MALPKNTKERIEIHFVIFGDKLDMFENLRNLKNYVERDGSLDTHIAVSLHQICFKNFVVIYLSRFVPTYLSRPFL